MADFKLGRLKFKWRGDWATSTGYLIDDIAKYGGNTYVCIQNHTSPAGEGLFYTDPGTYTDYWQLHGESFFFKGIYANATWYKLNDLVTYGGKQYRTTTAHTSTSAVIDGTKFEQYSDGITFRGDYASDTQYRLNDLVKYGGRTYRTVTEHTSASGGDANIVLGNFSLYSEGLAFLGDWATTTYYRLDDVVKFGSYQYKCTTAHTSGAGSADFAEGNFTVYSEGLQFEDSYNASTVYQKGDVVTYGGYSYVWVDTNEGSGRTPADDSYWDIITTGFNATGVYAHGTAYKTGDTVQYGGNSYVSILNNTNERPSQTDGTVNASYWKVVVEGFKWRGTWSSLTTYEVGDTVRYSSNSYTCLKDQQLNILPGSDATVWAIVAQGDTAAVLTTRGDMIVENAGGVGRLPLGLPGSFLTNDGEDIQWSTPSGGNVLWVSPSGKDGGTSTGTESAPFKTVGYALNRAKKNQIRGVENVSGGTGGSASTYFNVRAVSYKEFTVSQVPDTTSFEILLDTSAFAHTYVNGGSIRKADDSTLTVTNAPYNNVTGVITITTSGVHGLSINDKIRLKGMNYTCTQGSKTYPETGTDSHWRVNTSGGVSVTLASGGSYHNVGDKLRIDGADIGGATVPLLMDVASVAGDVLRVKNGTFKEQLPLRVREGVSVVGESLRNTVIMPASGKGTQIKTVRIVTSPSGATNKEYNYIHPDKVEKSFKVVSTPDSTSFTINPGTDSNVHTYISGGVVTTAGFGIFDISDAPYDNATGVITITTTASHGLSPNAIIKLSGLKYSCIYGEKTYPEVGQGAVFNITILGGEAKEIVTYHGGSGFNVGDIITIGTNKIGNGGDLVLRVGELEDSNACNMFLTNDGNNIRNSTFTGLTGVKSAGGLYPITVTASDSFVIPTSIAESAHNYVSGGKVTSEFDEFTVNSTPDGTSFTIDLGTSAFAHTYISGGQIRKADNSTLTVSDAPYDNATGIITITTSLAHGLSSSDVIKVANLKYTCSMGEKIYPKVGTEHTVGSMAFAHATGEITVNTNADHNLQTGDYVTITRAKWNITDVGERHLPKGVIQAAVMSLDPGGNILIKSPYIQNCTSVNPGACGLQVDGNLHKNTYTRSYKSMLGNDFTQINSDGVGIHILGNGRVEAVSVFIYYCDKAIWAESGGFIRGLNCSHAYGERACVSSGTDEDETPVNVKTRGLMLKWNATGFLGGATVLDIENCIAVQGQGTAVIQGDTSGATAKIFRFNNSLLYLHIENISGSFQDGETCTIEKEDSSTFQITLATGFGSPAQQGQRGPLLAIKSDRPTFIITVVDTDTFTTPLGISNFEHTYVTGGSVIKPDTTTVSVTAGTTYNNLSGLLTVNTSSSHGLTNGDVVTMEGLTFSCDQGNKTYPINGLFSNNIIKLASNVKFAGDDKYFRVGLVSEEDVTAGTAVVRLTEDIGLSRAKGDSIAAAISEGFSNIRLTGHDFLNIGTGDFVSTNYPHTPIQPADQADEVVEEDGGRIYWVSTDQQGDFRVGDLFKIEQATGTATLNADAFNLSGLSELKLGSIGAELGAAINEFSTDETLGGNSNNSVPTENAVLGYMTRDKSGTGAWVPPTGTTGQRPVGGSLFAGALRYNSSTINWEGYNGTSWTGLGGGTPWTTVVADGSTLTTATSGQRFLVNTQTATATINLPPTPLVGDSVVFLDIAGTFQTNNLTVGRNGNDIMNIAEDMNVTTNHAGFSLLYTGATNGWKLVEVA